MQTAYVGSLVTILILHGYIGLELKQVKVTMGCIAKKDLIEFDNMSEEA